MGSLEVKGESEREIEERERDRIAFRTYVLHEFISHSALIQSFPFIISPRRCMRRFVDLLKAN